MERGLQKVLVTEGGPGALQLATAFVLFGCPQPLSWFPLNLFCPGPARVHRDLLLKALEINQARDVAETP